MLPHACLMPQYSHSRSGFWRINLDYKSSLLTTFSTPFRGYRFPCMPFGITFASEVFQRAIEELFAGHPRAIGMGKKNCEKWCQSYESSKEHVKSIWSQLRRNASFVSTGKFMRKVVLWNNPLQTRGPTWWTVERGRISQKSHPSSGCSRMCSCFSWSNQSKCSCFSCSSQPERFSFLLCRVFPCDTCQVPNHSCEDPCQTRDPG